MTQPAETVLSTRLDGTEADAKLAHERISEMRRDLVTERRWLIGIAVGVMLVVGGGALTSHFQTREQLAGMAELLKAHEARMTGLEDGRTTPMAATTRERFGSLQGRLDRLERAIGRVEDGQAKILDRLSKRGAR